MKTIIDITVYGNLYSSLYYNTSEANGVVAVSGRCSPGIEVVGCLSADLYGVSTTTCFCNTDLCNDSPKMVQSMMLGLICIFVSIVFIKLAY